MDLTSLPSMSAPRAWTVSNIIWEEDTPRLSTESSAQHPFTIRDVLLDYGLLIVGQKIGSRVNQFTKQVDFLVFFTKPIEPVFSVFPAQYRWSP